MESNSIQKFKLLAYIGITIVVIGFIARPVFRKWESIIYNRWYNAPREGSIIYKEVPQTRDFARFLGDKVPPICIVLGGAMFAIGLIAVISSRVSHNENEQSNQDFQEKIEQLAKIRDQGLISEEEYEEKKKELLDEL